MNREYRPRLFVRDILQGISVPVYQLYELFQVSCIYERSRSVWRVSNHFIRTAADYKRTTIVYYTYTYIRIDLFDNEALPADPSARSCFPKEAGIYLNRHKVPFVSVYVVD